MDGIKSQGGNLRRGTWGCLEFGTAFCQRHTTHSPPHASDIDVYQHNQQAGTTPHTPPAYTGSRASPSSRCSVLLSHTSYAAYHYCTVYVCLCVYIGCSGGSSPGPVSEFRRI